jgi:hypothetical protein
MSDWSLLRLFKRLLQRRPSDADEHDPVAPLSPHGPVDLDLREFEKDDAWDDARHNTRDDTQDDTAPAAFNGTPELRRHERNGR